MEKQPNIVPHSYRINRAARNQKNGHGSCLVLFTGLSGSGKSTLANALENKLFQSGIQTYVLDGDNLRNGLNQDLGFSAADRSENIRRVAALAQLFVDAGMVTLAAFVAPFREDREKVAITLGHDRYFEIFVDTPLHVCEARDVKGLYKKAREGKIKDMTGISSPYERPQNPALTINGDMDIESATTMIYKFLANPLKKLI